MSQNYSGKHNSNLNKIINQGKAQALEEEPSIITIDYKVEQPEPPSKPKVPSSHDWANPREELKFQAEAERTRAMSLVYRYLSQAK